MGEYLRPWLRTFAFSDLAQTCSQTRVEHGGRAAPVAAERGGLLPSRLHGFRLKRALSRPWASMLRNCGMPSLALKNRVELGMGRIRGSRVFSSTLGSCLVCVNRSNQRDPEQQHPNFLGLFCTLEVMEGIKELLFMWVLWEKSV